MITSTKNYIKKKKRERQTLGQMVKAKVYRQNHTNKHKLHTHKRGKKNIYIYIYIFIKGREQQNQLTNLPMIISSKH